MSDLISRQAAIDAMEQAKERYFDRRVIIGKMQDIVNNLPSAQQWIPCSERLPEVGRTVICQCRADILKLLKLDSGGDWYQDAEHVYMSGFVIAWMPLPEPYKEEQE